METRVGPDDYIPFSDGRQVADLKSGFLRNIPLKPFTTFKIGGPARCWAPVAMPGDLVRALECAKSEGLPVFVLGGGSNVLISDAGLDAMVLHPERRGMSVLTEDSETALVQAEGGEIWDSLVGWAVDRRLWGIENLSHIPGLVGAALVQNIGAYGQQLSDVFESAELADLSDGAVSKLDREDCQLGYRKSIFNTTHKGCYFILNLTLRLSKRPRPNISYPDIKAWFEGQSTFHRKDSEPFPTLLQIREAIIRIRNTKFPFPTEEKGGNAGSFFKNLFLTREDYSKLEARIRRHFGPAELIRLQEVRARFSASEGIKIPTAFLMEICELKGCEVGGARVNESQPLVLLNSGGATARDVMLLARKVRQTLFARTGMVIPIEPELVGFTKDELEDYLELQAFGTTH